MASNSRVRSGALASLALATLALAGCVIAPYPRYAQPVYSQPGYAHPSQGQQPVYTESGPLVIAPVAPPPPLNEVVVVAPAPGYIWLGGFWSWSGSRHVWTAGHWAPPRAGHRWAPRQWSHGPNGWYQRGGRWER